MKNYGFDIDFSRKYLLYMLVVHFVENIKHTGVMMLGRYDRRCYSRYLTLLLAILLVCAIPFAGSPAASLPSGTAVNKPQSITAVRSLPRAITTQRIEMVGHEEMPTLEREAFVPKTIATDRLEMIGGAELPVAGEDVGWAPLSISTPRIEMIGSH